MNQAKICVEPLHRQVCNYIRQEIMEKRIMPGDSLNLREVSKMLGVSITPLRDALLRLEGEGLVEIIPRKGILLRGISPEEIRDSYEYIGLLDEHVIKKNYKKLGPQHFRRMREINNEMVLAAEKGLYDQCWTLNDEFHEVYSSLCENTKIYTELTKSINRLFYFPRDLYPTEEWKTRYFVEHETFTSLLEQGKPEEAASFQKRHHWRINQGVDL